MTKYAVIVAGGSGQRMGSEIPKQFLLLNDKPLLCHSIEAFVNAFNDINIILVLPNEHIEKGQAIINDYQYKNITITRGGETRFNSVKNGLQHIVEPCIVFVHDAVRCLVTPSLITSCYHEAVKNGNAVPAVAATDSLRIDDGVTNKTIDRNTVRIIQTPQTFKSDVLIKAFAQDHRDTFTDEASVVESLGEKIFLIEGEYDNLKITRPVDLFLAEQILQSRAVSFK